MATNGMGNKRFAALTCSVFAVGLMISSPANSQLSTSTIRGRVMVGTTQAQSGTQVIATNVATGFAMKTATRDDGSYTLVGLPPGDYHLQVSAPGVEQRTQVITILVGQSVDVDIDVSTTAARLEKIVVVGTQLIETKTSEVGTNVTPKQMERLPQVTRNFLSFADLAPGVSFVTKGDGSTQLQGGAQPAAAVNVYIDGVSQKNYVLQGGITGQDSSRGNPFPQSAIAEYKIITQNYKAEFDQVASAAITAVTKSGTNQFHGDAFWDHTETGWRERTPAEANSGSKADTSQDQFGLSMGGPIIPNRMHFFFSYEGKKNKDPRTVVPGAGVPVSALPPDLQALVGGKNAPFKEDLLFGKLDWVLNAGQRIELTAKLRRESETTNLGGQNTEPWSTEKKNDETRVNLKHQFATNNWVNEAHVTYEDAYWNPRPTTLGPGTRFETGGGTAILNVGGGPDFQNKGQKGFSLQDDLTFTGLAWNGSHVVKAGVKLKSVTLDAQELQPYNPQFFYDVNYSLTTPYRLQFGRGIEGVGNGTAQSKNKQFGIYIQDDWEMNRHLTWNLGVRWDYENSPSYTDFVTPADVVAALRGWPNINSAASGLNINDFISTGSNRNSYKGAFQPRLGFSYDFNADQRHVAHGGYGRSYDRNIFDYLQLEKTKQTFPTFTFNFPGDPNHPCTPAAGNNCIPWDPAYLTPAGLATLVASGGGGREIDLLSNNLKVPYADQMSLGIRNVFGTWNTEVTYSYIDYRDGFVWLLGNRRSDGQFFAPGATWGPPFGDGIPGFGALILGTSGLQTKTHSIFLKAERPYTRSAGWGATVAYTYSDSKENRKFDEHYALDYPTLTQYGWKPSSGVSKHRVVATGLLDLPAGLEFAAKLTLASGAPFYGVNCLDGWDRCRFDQGRRIRESFIFPSKLWAFRQLDLALQKEFSVGFGARLKLRADVLNIFNHKNWDGYNDWFGAPGEPDPSFGTPNLTLAGPTRTLKLSIGMTF